MRIGLDMSRMGYQRGGEERYAVNLARALGRIDPHNEYLLYFATPGAPDLTPGANFQNRRIGPSSSWIRTPVTLPRAAWRDAVDVLHVVHVRPPLCPSRVVVTAFDASYEEYPEYYPAGLRFRLSVLVPLSLRRAAGVLTISEYSKRQLTERYRVPAEKIEVVSCGVDTDLYHAIPGDEARARLHRRYRGIKERFIVCVGSLQPRKNVPRLLEAYSALVARERIEHQLVLVGKWKWLTAQVEETLRRLRLGDRVMFTGHVPDADLPLFLNAAEAMVFPSISEGFGLPALEAMACGTPVVCSAASSIPEVVGDAAVLVDPFDVDDIARGLREILSDAGLRCRLRDSGLIRARSFSWDETARKALKVFEAVARNGR